MSYERILVFAAHPDDELTMAGTMGKLAQQGVKVFVAQMTNGSEGYPKPEWKNKIVRMRRAEAKSCDKVIGITKRYMLNKGDMALADDKPTLKQCIQIVREVRPDAAFIHGPDDMHRDHRNTHAISRDALWHAGEPVAAELGAPWKTPHVYFYKGVATRKPSISFDVSETAWKRPAALATQVSQHTLFRRTKEQFEEDAQRMKANPGKAFETFWIAEEVRLAGFLPRGL
jgi:LmbE family N-acetylglucosaminyl deacetylase